MRKILFALTLAFVAACGSDKHQSNVLDVVPYPDDVQAGEGEFNAKGAAVTYDASLDEATVNIIKSFAEKLSVASGAESAVA